MKRTNKVLLLCLLTASVLCSCIKHEDTIDVGYQVGNILCSDGSVIHPSLFDGSTKIAVGVVFWTNINNEQDKAQGYAVSLQDLPSNYMIEKEDNIKGVSDSEIIFNGHQNTVAIRNYAIKEEIPCPAVESVLTFTDIRGWYIPSVAEIRELMNNREKVYDTFKVVNGLKFCEWYWTSTQDGVGQDTQGVYMLTCSIEEGRITPSQKTNSHKVRPIIAIR